MNKQFVISFLCGVMLVAGTACKNENTPENKTVQKRHLTIRMSDEGQSTKVSPRHIKNATIDDMGTTLSAEWTAGDAVSCCNLSTANYDVGNDEYSPYIGSMTATTTGRRSDLTGDVECIPNDYLAIVYPAANLADESYIEGSAPIHCKYILSLAGQDGTLERLASTYHYSYGRAHIVSVNGDNAEATMDKMQSLMTVCKFSFVEKDHESNGALPITTLKINYGGDGSDANTYPQTATVDVTNMTENSAVQAATATSAEFLTIAASEATEVYVALMPTIASRTYNFTVTNDNGIYTGTAEAWLKKGEYVPATGLKLTKQ